MSAAGFTPIQLYRSTTASAAPTAGNLADGELAINTNDGKLYYKDSGGIVQLIASKAGASGDVVGPASATDNAIVRFDGTTGKLVQNSVVTIADSTGDISGVGQLNATTVDTTNIEVTNIKAKDGTAAATIADSTGVVSITANPVLSGGTANGVLYLNGSKVATSGSALTFDGTNLISGTVQASNSGGFYITNNASSDALQVISRSSGTDNIEFGNTGAGTSAPTAYIWDTRVGGEQMRLTSTGLGIGTSSPSNSAKLDAAGSIISTNATLNTFNANNAGFDFIAASKIGRFFATSTDTTGGVMTFTTGQNGTYTERMRLDSSGNLGLGVTPSAWRTNVPFKVLQVGYTAALYGIGNIEQANLASNYYQDSSGAEKRIQAGYATKYQQASGAHTWSTAGTSTADSTISFTQAMTLDASGNLGIGTTTANSRLEIQASAGEIARFSTAAGYRLHVYANASGNSGSGIQAQNSDLRISAFDSSTNIRFFTGDGSTETERARITSGGDLQISSGGSFQVGGTAARATTAGTNRVDIFNGTAPVGTLTNGISLYSSSGEAYVMDAAGNATLFSPHDAETNEWVFKSKHTPTGKVLKIDVEKLLRFVNDHFGLDAVHEFIES